MGTTDNRLGPAYRPGEFLLRQWGVVGMGNNRVSEPGLLSQVQIPRSANYNYDDGDDVFLGMLLKLT